MRLLLLFLFSVSLCAQTRLTVNVGNTSNDGTGDSVRAAMQKINTNFTTLFATVYTNGAGAKFIRTDASTNILSGTVIVDGNLTNSVSFDDLLNLTLDSSIWSATGVQSTYLDGGITTLRGVTNLNIITPGVTAGSVSNNYVLRLTDEIEGTVEFRHIEEFALSGGASLINSNLRAWANTSAFSLTSATRDTDGVITTATVSWPDGSVGTFTTVTKNSVWLTVDAYTVTHTSSGKTVTQSAVTRDGSGRVTAQPALTITP